MKEETLKKYNLAKEEYINTDISVTKISKKYHMDRYKFSKFLSDNNIIVKLKKKTPEQYKEAINLYKNSTLSLVEVGNMYGISGSTLKEILIADDLNITLDIKDKYYVNNSYFEKIDSEEKAYWLGFLYADGYNSNSYIQLAINKIDYEHVKKFRKALYSNHPIKNNENCSRIIINDEKLTNDLKALGCIKNKTYYATFPSDRTVKHSFYSAFIRGFFDGDGSISKMYIKNGKRLINKVSFAIKNKNFAESMVKAIKETANINFNIYHVTTNNADQYDVYLNGNDNIANFLNYIYKDATIFLNRKYIQYLKFIMPSYLEIDKIINAELSGKSLPDYEYDQRPTRTED